MGTDTPSIALYKAYLEAFINWQVADGCLKPREIYSLREAVANRKERSKKIIDLTVIDADSYTVYCQDQQKKNANKRGNKKATNQQPQQARKGNYYYSSNLRAHGVCDYGTLPVM